jgi:ubiquinol oxidase
MNKFIKLYHKSSTRYTSANREFLTTFETLWKKEQPHYTPVSFADKSMLKFVGFLRKITDWYFKEELLHRAVMLETVAAVPGIVNGFYHHMRSVRTMNHDHWIKVMMDEAENERMHLMSLMELYRPTTFQRGLLISAQGVFFTFYFLLYALSKSTAHRFVGYLEEEAVKTYTHFLHLIDEGKIQNHKAPSIAKEYWGLSEDATLRDLVLVIRADEADHRLVNHVMSDVYVKREDDCTFNLDIHNPWQADSIRSLEELKATNREILDEHNQKRSTLLPKKNLLNNLSS